MRWHTKAERIRGAIELTLKQKKIADLCAEYNCSRSTLTRWRNELRRGPTELLERIKQLQEYLEAREIENCINEVEEELT